MGVCGQQYGAAKKDWLVSMLDLNDRLSVSTMRHVGRPAVCDRTDGKGTPFAITSPSSTRRDQMVPVHLESLHRRAGVRRRTTIAITAPKIGKFTSPQIQRWLIKYCGYRHRLGDQFVGLVSRFGLQMQDPFSTACHPALPKHLPGFDAAEELDLRIDRRPGLGALKGQHRGEAHTCVQQREQKTSMEDADGIVKFRPDVYGKDDGSFPEVLESDAKAVGEWKHFGLPPSQAFNIVPQVVGGPSDVLQVSDLQKARGHERRVSAHFDARRILLRSNP